MKTIEKYVLLGGTALLLWALVSKKQNVSTPAIVSDVFPALSVFESSVATMTGTSPLTGSWSPNVLFGAPSLFGIGTGLGTILSGVRSILGM